VQSCGSILGAGLGAIALLCAASASAETPLERGTYLMHGIVACGNCHTPKGPDFKPMNDQELSGGFVIDAPVFHAIVPNITPDKETGIGGWSPRDVVRVLRTGQLPNGDFVGSLMGEVVNGTSKLTDTDRQAIAVYLQSLPPIADPDAKAVKAE
jgi:mono/diheme cytochrome c family protein